MTVTLDIDEKIVERARELAKLRGTSIETMLSEYLRELAGEPRMTPEEAKEMVKRLERMWAMSHGDSRGEKWTREELHERKDVP
jgi:hypothetical protein